MYTAIRSFFSLRPVRQNVPLRAARIGAAAIVLSQALDYLTTTIGIQLGAVETNPIMAPVVSNWALFLFIKGLASTFLVWVGCWYQQPACAGAVALTPESSRALLERGHDRRVPPSPLLRGPLGEFGVSGGLFLPAFRHLRIGRIQIATLCF
jgi:hypothetical protein